MSYKKEELVMERTTRMLDVSAERISYAAGDQSSITALLSQVEKLESALKNQQQYIDRLQQDAMIDPLTGIYNRRMFESELSRIIHACNRYGRHGALVMIDLDGFKAVNDSLGHIVGDQLLKHVANLLKQNVRTSDLVARLGGDEFAIILTDVRSGADAEKCAEFLTQTVASTPFIREGGSSLYASISAGSYTFGKGETIEEVITQADTAMYEKKRSKV